MLPQNNIFFYYNIGAVKPFGLAVLFFLFCFSVSAQNEFKVFEIISKTVVDDYKFIFYENSKSSILQSEQNLKSAIVSEYLKNADSAFVETLFMTSKFYKEDLKSDTLFVKRLNVLDDILLRSTTQNFIIQSFGNLKRNGCTNHLRPGFHLSAVPLNKEFYKSKIQLSFYFRESEKNGFKEKTPKPKRYNVVAYAVDSLSNVMQSNLQIVSSGTLQASFYGWVNVDFEMDIAYKKYLVIGLETLDYNVVTPCFRISDELNSDFITLILKRNNDYLNTSNQIWMDPIFQETERPYIPTFVLPFKLELKN